MTPDELRTVLIKDYEIWGPALDHAMEAIDAYVAAERERLAQAIEAIRTDGRSSPDWEIGHHSGLDDAARIVRESEVAE